MITVILLICQVSSFLYPLIENSVAIIQA